MNNSRKLFRLDERGFTLIELLIIVLVLAIIAGVVVPNVIRFIDTANLAAANGEVATIRTAADAYYSDAMVWPDDSSNFASDGLLDREPEEIYSFDTANGLIDGIDSTGKWIDGGLSFNTTSQQWE